MKQGNCLICNEIVNIFNCDFRCNNCGYTGNWDDDQETNQVDLIKEREEINVNIKRIS